MVAGRESSDLNKMIETSFDRKKTHRVEFQTQLNEVTKILSQNEKACMKKQKKSEAREKEH